MNERRIIQITVVAIIVLIVVGIVAAFFLPEGTECANGVYPDGKGGVTVTVECE
jgi:hypothetical protein